MNRTKYIFPILAASLLLSCQFIGRNDSDGDRANLVILHGYSFGFCFFHCKADMTIKEGEQSLILSSWDRDRDPPDKFIERSLDSASFERIARTVNLAVFCSMDEIYGCPDCTDGGAEYVTLECNGENKSVTFEYGEDLPELRSLLAEIRPLRQALLDELQ